MKLELEFYFCILPIINIKVQKAISTRPFIAALLFPFFVINTLLIIWILLFPEYVHYASILLAYHTGICAIDFKFARSLLSSPNGALIEESEDGYEILVQEN